MRFLFLAISFIFSSSVLFSQHLPKEGSYLNYRLIGFSFPEDKKNNGYVLQIAEGDHKTNESFSKNIFCSVSLNTTSRFEEVPRFGEEYTWRVIYSGTRKNDSTLHHFSIMSDARIDTSKLRLRVIQPTNRYKDLFVSVDAGGVIYDIKGVPVAFLPERNGITGELRDLSFTKDGTITLNHMQSAYEVNLNSDILWRTPDHNSVNEDTARDSYHHEVKKLANGHYMVMGMEIIMTKRVVKGDSVYSLFLSKGTSPQRLPPFSPFSAQEKSLGGYIRGIYGTLVEFDKKGNVVWSWRDSKRLVGTDFDYFTPKVDSHFRFDPHSNSFFFDEQRNVIYVSYRNISRISKIEYPSGKVLNIYGENFKPGSISYGYDLLCYPHAVKRLTDGNLCFFNNNSCRNSDSLPSVVIFKEPASYGDSVKKVWEYTCTVEGNYPRRFVSGGNANEMPDGSLFVCMGSVYSKIFIVDRSKKVLWSALPERYSETENNWSGTSQYRANYIERNMLEQLIWVAENAANVK
ncbi:MAG: aryl-sulfate sulfotransferase [Flavipsychrobacter sp.]|nr:aryl-sulfate sulfotransferase [Flavipsychrobacter sp.]